jgi:hypothetical protein
VVSAVRSLVGGGSKAGASQSGGAKKSGGAKRSSGGASRTTIDRDEIRNWVEARGGFPAHVTRTAGPGEDPGVLRIDYPGFSGTESLERIEWDEWFDWFDKNKLAFLYQDKKNSRFSKLVAR